MRKKQAKQVAEQAEESDIDAEDDDNHETDGAASDDCPDDQESDQASTMMFADQKSEEIYVFSYSQLFTLQYTHFNSFSKV